MQYIGILLVFSALFLLIMGVIRLVTARRTAVLQRMERFTTVYRDEEHLQTIADQADGKQEGRPVKPSDKSWYDSYATRLTIHLAKADILLHPHEYILLTAGVSGVAGLIFLLLSGQFLLMLLGFIMGLTVSNLYVRMKKNHRIFRINQQLVDAITLMSNALKAGYSFLQAAGMVSRDMRPPISDEFCKMIRQSNLGVPVEQALLELSERCESQDLDLVVTAILIQRQIGGNLAEVLDNITSTIRERVRLKKEIKTKTAQGRLSGMILMFLPPGLAFIIYLMSPEFMGALFVNPLGWFIMIVAALLQIIGIFFILKIISIDV